MLEPRQLESLVTQKCSLGCPVLDRCLAGGLPCRSVTEITGEAAASKTQLCLQALLSAQLPEALGGLGGSAVYVYTEGEPAMKRLQELSSLLRFRVANEAALAGLPDPTSNIFLERGIATGTALLARLQRLRPLLASPRPRPVRLLVVDSVAAVLRDLGGGGEGAAAVGVAELSGRTALLFQIAALLRQYADEFNLAVLVVNQIVDSVDNANSAGSCGGGSSRAHVPAKNTGHTGGMRLESLGREVVPALGLAWANCVNTRIFLSRCAAPGSGSTPALYHGARSAAAQRAAAAGAVSSGGGSVGVAPPLRRMVLVFSPHLPQQECYYVVEATGLRGLAPEDLVPQETQHWQQPSAAAAWQGQQQQQAVQQQQQQPAAAVQAWPGH